MILKSIYVQNYGPFALSTNILVDKNLTILTGQNDVGKSSLLKLLNAIGNKISLTEDDVNVDHMHETSAPWNEDTSINCILTYGLTEEYEDYIENTTPEPILLLPNYEVDIKFFLSPKTTINKIQVISARDLKGKTVSTQSITVRKLPKVLLLPLQEEVSSTLDTMVYKMNSLESEFLTLAFGENYGAKLKILTKVNLTREIQKAAERLTQKAKAILPESMELEFVLDKISSDKNENLKLAVSLRDKNNSDTSLHLRGTGVRKIINVLVAILDKLEKITKSENLLILFDEPENSLHANAQHTLRSFLEELSTSENIQIVYATHSPSMINPMQAHQVRLFERINKDGKATTIVHNQPITENFLPIRSSLGISPTDSLLYAPITIIVEGATEVLGLPILLKRLYDEKIEGFELIGKLFPLSHMLDGNGSSFKHWCGMAISQGCKPIIFVDGDKHREVVQQKVNDSYPDVPIVLLDKWEFEEIVPQSLYLQALKESLEIDEISLDAFSTWNTSKNLPARMAFSKRIDIWLEEIYPNSIYYKWDVMKRAIEKVDLADINLEPFRKLVQYMIQALNTSQT